MKVSSLEIKNVKSFQETTILCFDTKFNILVGPNGGGKSNLLDIINIILRNFFLITYKITSHRDEYNYFENIHQHSPFQQINTALEKFIGDVSDSYIKIKLKIENQDINNIILLKKHKEDIKTALSSYQGNWLTQVDEIEQWDLSCISPNQEVTYSIRNNTIEDLSYGTPEHIFYRFLCLFQLFMIAAKKVNNIKLSPRYVYFSPYRGETQLNLQASLSSENYYDLLANYSSTTSKTSTSLMKLSSLYFAEKKRLYENSALNQGYQDKWNNDEEVKLVTKYLSKLGYSWDLKLKDANKNIYEITLSKEGKTFDITQASSGEKEILNFLLGIFAFNIKDGLVIVDEPEVHLHPRWQSILIELFFDLANTTGNQFILSTHSAVFINQKTISNIIRVYKFDSISIVATINRDNLLASKDLLHIINSHNNEKIFFADKVVLVEGVTDRLFFEKLINVYQLLFIETPEVIEVLEVYGKENLEKYRNFLQAISVPNFIVADYDYLQNIGNEDIKNLFVVDHSKIDQQVIKHKKSIDGQTLSQQLEQAINNGDIESLKNLYQYIKSRKRKIKDNLTSEESILIEEFLSQKESQDIFILRNGEIEDYLPDGNKTLEKLIGLLKDKDYLNFIVAQNYSKQRQELTKIIFSVLKISSKQDQEVILSLKDYQINDARE
ncbi:MAG: AAA family ATPase [Nostoc sp.]|uniref:ATP-dependent nuclease n=1 Tax=Nostoc sp. TaxID=1180 RepID=UPI002FF70026